MKSCHLIPIDQKSTLEQLLFNLQHYVVYYKDINSQYKQKLMKIVKKMCKLIY